MKAVVIGEGAGATREAMMAVFPGHKIVVDKFKGRGDVIGIDPFTSGGMYGDFQNPCRGRAIRG